MVAHSQHSHHHPGPHARGGSGTALVWAFALTLVYALVEALGGFWAGSLALLGDAGHMFSDAVALGLAVAAAWFSQRPPSARHSYGLARVEILTALLNSLLMLGVVAAIVIAAIQRFQAPKPVAGEMVMGIAWVGLLVNLLVARILMKGDRSLNMRAALLHVVGDILGSCAALAAGVVIYYTGWTPIDPLLSLVICALILYSTVRLLFETLHVLMEGVPANVNLNHVGNHLARVPGVVSVHDLHIWTLASGTQALSAHVVMVDLSHWNRVLGTMRSLLQQDYGIEHITLQPETPEAVRVSADIPVRQGKTPKR